MNSERQKTISQVLVMESCRTNIPPDDQQIAATIMNTTARRCRVGLFAVESLGKLQQKAGVAPADRYLELE